jgi:hypothetical protein
VTIDVYFTPRIPDQPPEGQFAVAVLILPGDDFDGYRLCQRLWPRYSRVTVEEALALKKSHPAPFWRGAGSPTHTGLRLGNSPGEYSRQT